MIDHEDPIKLFLRWQAQARGYFDPERPIAAAVTGWLHGLAYRSIRRFVGSGELPYANVAALATASSEGRPAVRMVLVKEASEAGFVFYTDYRSRKADELADNPWAALALHFPLPPRQVRVEGPVFRLSRPQSEAYWRSRPRGSQLSAAASHQSAELSSRAKLVARVRQLEARYRGMPVPLPSHWGGYRIVPEHLEFWQGRADRLHERWSYDRDNDSATSWKRRALQP